MSDYEVIRQGINLQGTRFWNFSATPINTPGNIVRQEGCFAIMLTNIGDAPCSVNGMIMYPGVPGTSLGDSRSLSGHVLDLFKGQLNVSFGAGANPNLEVVQFFYVDITVNK